MEEESGTEGGEEGSHHAGLEWEGILRSYQEGGHPIIPIDCQLVEQDWGKPLLTQLPWEDVLFENLLPCLQVKLPHLLTSPLLSSPPHCPFFSSPKTGWLSPKHASPATRW